MVKLFEPANLGKSAGGCTRNCQRESSVSNHVTLNLCEALCRKGNSAVQYSAQECPSKTEMTGSCVFVSEVVADRPNFRLVWWMR